MGLHNQFGKQAEELAEKYFTALGFEIMFRNWRHSHFEIDLIARKNGMLHFIEVKARQSPVFGMPEQSVSKKKLKFLMTAADEFLFRNPQYKNIQFDVLSILVVRDKEPEFFFIEDLSL